MATNRNNRTEKSDPTASEMKFRTTGFEKFMWRAASILAVAQLTRMMPGLMLALEFFGVEWPKAFIAYRDASTAFTNGDLLAIAIIALNPKSIVVATAITRKIVKLSLCVRSILNQEERKRDRKIERQGERRGQRLGYIRGQVHGHTSGRAEGRIEGRAEGRIEGRAEGRAEIARLWREWNQRRVAAEQAGEPFNEPTPDNT